VQLVLLVICLAFAAFRSPKALLAENLMLRHQLIVLQRSVGRPQLRPMDRLLWAAGLRRLPNWKKWLVIVRPETVIRWHRMGFKLFWRWRSSMRSGGRPPLPRDVRNLIICMARENLTWGSRRIQGELLKLGRRVGRTTIRRILREVRGPYRPSASWRSFLRSQAQGIWSCDVFTVTTVPFRQLYVMVIIAHATRELRQIAVTDSPSTQWCIQVIREATPFDVCPKFLIHDNDARFGDQFDRALRHMGIRPISTPLFAPLANAICERVIGTLRREVLDHMLIWNARHLVRTLHEARRWYNEARPHQALGQQTPRCYTPPQKPVPPSDVVSISVLGGLHHEYRPKAA
jgi:putative transposase